jgi:hypothetical protein
VKSTGTFGITLASAAVVVAVVGVRIGSHPAHADPSPRVRDFYGEADEDVTAVTPAPTGMACGMLSVGNGLTIQTSEPPEGFSGACLMERPYSKGLPSVCYSPTNGSYDISLNPTQCKIPAASVVQPNWHLSVDQTNHTVTRENIPTYRVMETCGPHLATPSPDCAWGPDGRNGSCPCNMTPVSHSCCTQYGTPMDSADGMTASGTAYFRAL